MVPVVRASEPLPPPPHATATAAAAPAGGGSGGRKLLIVLAAVAVLAIIGFGVHELTKEKPYEVGQCVEVTDGVLSDDIEAVDCPTDGIDLSGDVYRVASVIDGDGGYCPYADITFSHEPHDKTYCLVYPTLDEAYERTTTPSDEFTGDGEPPECYEPELRGEEPPDWC